MQRVSSFISYVFFSALLFMSVVFHYYHYCHLWQLSEADILHPRVVEGVVISLPQQTLDSVRFDFQLTRFDGKKAQGKLKLGWYKKCFKNRENRNNVINCSESLPTVNFGELWRFTVKVKPLHGYSNPGSINNERRLKWEDFIGSGYIVNNQAQTRLGIHVSIIQKMRMKILNEILKKENSITEKNNTLVNSETAGFVIALTTGFQNHITEAQWDILKKTGTVHLMIVAGLHLGFLGFWLYALSQAVWKRFEKLSLYFPAPRFACLFSLLSVIFYGTLCGDSVATERAVIMMAVFLGLQFFYYSIPLWRRLSIAFFVILLIQPFSLFLPGFWLSFGAVFMIAFTTGGRLRPMNHFLLFWKIQWTLFVGLLPLTLLFFHEASLGMIFTNAFAIPWMTFLILPLCLVGVLVSPFASHAASILFNSASWLFLPLWKILQVTSQWPGMQWSHLLGSPWVFVCAVLAAFLILAPQGWPSRWMSVLALLPLFFYKAAVPSFGSVWITMLDVGEGLSVVVQTAQHVLVYDAGPAIGNYFNAGEAIISPFLEIEGIHSIDLMMISHGDNDHIGGAFALLKHFPVSDIATSVPDRFVPQQVEYCHVGQYWVWDGVEFEVLYPYKNLPYLGNNSSCVLRVTGAIIP